MTILATGLEQRASFLQDLAILDTPREERFDRIVRLACRLMRAPIGMVTLADTNRMWFKSCSGLEVQEVPHELAFCSHALRLSETLVISDAAADPRFADHPLVVGADHIRFYAGAQLRTTDGIVLGTLCVLDREPKHLEPSDIAALEDLAHGVIAELDLRRISAQLERQLAAQRQAAAELAQMRERVEDFLDATADLLWETNADLTFIYGGGGSIRGLDFEEFRGRSLIEAIESFSLPPEKGPFATLLGARQSFHLAQLGRRSEDGSEVWIETSGKPIFRDGQFQGYRGVSRDITARKAAEERIRRMADEDPLTGLANRRAFQRQLAISFDRRRPVGAGRALLLLDIDHFKSINDRYGHDIGDRMIRTVGQRISAVIREGDTLARLGGDEFAILLSSVDRSMTEDIARRIVAAMHEPIATPDGDVAPSVSVGAVIVSDIRTDPDDALKCADVALYQAKHAGRGRYAVFEGAIAR